MQQRFWFQAVDKNGKTVSGSVFADSLDAAQEKLRKEDFAILSLKNYDEVEKTRDMSLVVFEFDAVDESGKHVHGTIEADEEYTAYRKLLLDYGFEVLSLYRKDLSIEEKKSLKDAGISESIKERFNKDAEALKRQKTQEKQAAKDQKEEREYNALLKKKEDEVSFVREQVEEVIAEVDALLNKNDAYIEPSHKRAIRERLDLLARLRQSNAIGHLKNLTKRIFDEIQDDAFFLKTVGLTDEEIAERKGEFAKLGASLEKRFDRGLISLQEAFAKVDTEKVTAIVKEIHVIEIIESLVFFLFVTILGFSLVFWSYIGLLYVSGFDVMQAEFFFGSSSMWFMTIFSALMVICLEFARLYRIDKASPKKKALYIAGGTIMVLFFIFQFPAIFFWTR